MAKGKLNRVLATHLNTIHETLQILDVAPDSSLEKVSWKDVIQMSEQVSKQATNVGMLYSERESPGVKALEEIMSAYYNILQGFLFLSHGSLIGAGQTLTSCIHKSVKQVVDTSFTLFHEAVSSHGAAHENQKIPQLVGAVWVACSAIKKTPTTNVTAIGRAMTQVAVSVKDVLREMKELKPASHEADESHDDDGDDSDGDLGNDLSPEEMNIVQLTSNIVSDVLVVIRELIRSVTSLLKQETPDHCSVSVPSSEKLLRVCQQIGVQIDDLGACLYPPQEISGIKMASGKILGFTSEMESELQHLVISTDDFHKACSCLRDSVRKLESELCTRDGDGIVQTVENLVIY